MDKKSKIKLLKSIGDIYDKSQNCALEPGFFKEINKELVLLSKYFGVTKTQAFFTALVFALTYEGVSAGTSEFVSHLKCNPVKILEYTDDLDQLCESGLFVKHRLRRGFHLPSQKYHFVINPKIGEAILQNKSMPAVEPDKITDIYGLLEKFNDMSEMRATREISTTELLSDSYKLITDHPDFLLIKNTQSFGLNQLDLYIFFYIVWQTISHDNSTRISDIMQVVFDNTQKRVNAMQAFKSEKHILIKSGLIELEEESFFNNTNLVLSEFSHTILSDSGILLYRDKKKNRQIVSPTDIPKRELIFGESEMHQLFLLKDVLKPNKLEEMQKRLSRKNMPKGLTVLLHGLPGTGKTEIVNQLARETGRELMKVDISQSKSMWFGESEKTIKYVFTDYKALAKTCAQTPILFFNEADAILSKRQSIGASNVAQTENAIQNILLEEIENFEGILFATTNLISNLDSAFDRRFLFKINFQKPSISIKAKIWKLKLPDLETTQHETLAKQFDFSGGQIDNVVRKIEIRETVYGEQVSFMRILDFCREETLTDNRICIGFTKSIN